MERFRLQARLSMLFLSPKVGGETQDPVTIVYVSYVTMVLAALFIPQAYQIQIIFSVRRRLAIWSFVDDQQEIDDGPSYKFTTCEIDQCYVI